jgi:BlaI family penicillinase repressor
MPMGALPDLSRFELQCLRLLARQGRATIREIHDRLDAPPSYSTVKKIIERLDAKGAVKRVAKREKAWVYAPTVSTPAMIRKEVRRLLDTLFDGAGAGLVAHLAETDEISLEDLKEIEALVAARNRKRASEEEEDRR